MTDSHDSNAGGDHNATEFEELVEGINAGEVSVEDLTLESEVDQLTREVNQFKDTALRLQADFENYRKRVAAQQGVEIERAAGKVVESLLPVLDACEAAFTHGADGVEPIWSQLMGVLQKQGLEALDLAGKA